MAQSPRLPTPPRVEVLEHVEAVDLPADAPATSPGGVRLARGLSAQHALWAVIDGAGALELVFHARRLGHRVYTLFDGDMAAEVATSGPCLVPISQRGAFADVWANWLGKSAGVLVEGSEDLDRVLGQMRSAFVVRGEDEQAYFFRFYDPRILREYLPSCRPEELDALFGGVVHAWIVESADGESWERHALGLDGVDVQAWT